MHNDLSYVQVTGFVSCSQEASYAASLEEDKTAKEI